MPDSKNNFGTEIFDLTRHSWEDIKERIIFIEHEAFEDKAFTEEHLLKDFQNENNTVVLLRNTDSKEIVGFTYTEPSKEKTAYICDVVIKESHRNKHLVGMLMDGLETELKRGGYVYMESDSSVANNYAENISKHYKNRIVEQGNPHDSIYGQQVFFRIRL